jgi:hypothetical protein
MANPVNAIQRSNADGLFEVSQFAGSAANVQMPVFSNHGDAGRIVSTIFEAFQAVEYQGHDAFRPDITDNSAHGESLLGNSLASKARPVLVHLG